MKKLEYIFSAMLGVLVMTGCSSNDDVANGGNEGNKGKEIILGYTIDGNQSVTRSTYNLDTKMGRGDKVYSWIFDSGKEYGNTAVTTEKALYGATTYVHIRDGELSPLNITGSTVFREYPLNNHTVNIYAVHGNMDGLVSQDMAYPSSAMTYSVKTDQTTIDNYSVSDLMYADTANVNNATDTVKLRFSHLLSKISVVPKLEANQNVTISRIDILNTMPSATLTFNNTNRANNPSVVATGSTGTITMAGEASYVGSADVENEAILIPQTIASGTSFIKIVLTNGTYYTYKTSSAITFEAGKSYRFVLTLHESPILTGYTVDDWAAGNWDTSHPNGQEIFADQDE